MTFQERLQQRQAGTAQAPASGVSGMRAVEGAGPYKAAADLRTPYADAAKGNAFMQRLRPGASTHEKLTGDTPVSVLGKQKEPAMSYSQMQKELAQKQEEMRQLDTNSTYSPIALAALYDNVPTQEQWEAEQQQKRTDLQGQIDALQGNIQKEDALRSNRLGRVQNNRTMYADQLAEAQQQKAEAEAKPEIARRGPTPGKNVREEHEEQLEEARSTRNTTHMLERRDEIANEIDALDEYWKTYGEGQRNTGIYAAFNPDADFGPEELSREDYERKRDALIRERDAIDSEYRIIKGKGPYEGEYAKYLNYAEDRDSAIKGSDYAVLTGLSDFDEKSRADARAEWNDEEAPNYVNEKGYAWEVYDYLNNIDGARERFDTRSKEGYGPEYAKYQLMTDDEIAVYNYLYNTKGAGKALEFLNWMDPKLNKQMFSGRQEAVNEWVGQNAATKIAGSAATIAAMPAREIISAAAGIQDVWGAITGKGIDSYSELSQFIRMVQGVREEVSRDMGTGGTFLYNTAMSAGDSFMNMQMASTLAKAMGYTGDNLLKATNFLGSTLMSSEVFASEVAAGIDKGYKPAEALGLAAIRSGIETATELIGGERVIELIKANPESFLRSMIRGMAPEGLEEVAGSLANEGVNAIWDAVFGTEESYIGQAVKKYKGKDNAGWLVALTILDTELQNFAGGSLASIGSSYVQASNYQDALEYSASKLGTDKHTVVGLMEELGYTDPGKMAFDVDLYGAKDADTFKDIRQKINEIENAINEGMQAAGNEAQGLEEQRADALAAMRENTPTTPGTDPRADRAAQEEEYRQLWEAHKEALDAGDKETADQQWQQLKELEAEIGKSPVEILTGARQYDPNPTVDPRAEEAAQMEEDQQRRESEWYTAPPVDMAEGTPAAEVEEKQVNSRDNRWSDMQEAEMAEGEAPEDITEERVSPDENRWYEAPPVDMEAGVPADLITNSETGENIEQLEREALPESGSEEAERLEQEREREEGRPFLEQGERNEQREPAPGVNPRKQNDIQLREEQQRLQTQQEQQTQQTQETQQERDILDQGEATMPPAVDTEAGIPTEINRAISGNQHVTFATEGGQIGTGEHAQRYSAVDFTKLTNKQKNIISAVRTIADTLGVDVHIISAKGSLGGAYVGGGRIFLNIDSGNDPRSFYKQIAAASFGHELTHWMQDYAKDEYQALKDYVKSSLSPEQLDWLIQEQRHIQKNLTEDQAMDEVVANACQNLLENSEALQNLVRQNRSLGEKIMDFIKEFLEKIRDAFKDVDIHDNIQIYHAAQEMEKYAEGLQKAFDKALVAAKEAMAEESTQVGSIDLRDFQAAENTDGEPLFQIQAFEHDEDEYREMLRTAGMSEQKITDLFSIVDAAMAKIQDNLEALDYAQDADIDDRAFQPVKPNSDDLYKVSMDFSTLCRKRILQGLVQGELSAALDRGLSRDEGIAIRDALKAIQDEGKQIEVACGLCYVESARMRSQKAIQEFLNDREKAIRNYFASKEGGDAQAAAEAAERQKIWEENGQQPIRGKDGQMLDIRDRKAATMKTVPTNIKKRIQAAKRTARSNFQLSEAQQRVVDKANSLPVTAFTTPEGLQDLAKHDRDIFNAFVLKVSAASKSKSIEDDVWWRAGDAKEISDKLIQEMNKQNGLRTQSWSDFQVKHLMDYIAATIELSTRQAKMHGYTKVPDYVRLMGNTGVMINMSLIPTRDFNGTLEYDPVEGINADEAMELREQFPDTAGTICIGVNNDQILLLLSDDGIDYVIPYHKSGMSKEVRAKMNIPGWDDYEDYQGEKTLKGAEAQKNAKRFGVELLSEDDPNWHEKPVFSDWFDLAAARKTQQRAGTSGEHGVMTGGYAAMKEAADRYLQMCAERGLAPKFSYGKADFADADGYWKLLIDRKMINNKTGEMIEQKAIQPTFDMDTIQQILDDELERYGPVKADQDEAIQRVTEAFISGRVKGGMTAEQIKEAMQQPVDNVPITNITQNGYQLQTWEEEAETDAAQEDFNADGKPAEFKVQFSVFEDDPETLEFLDKQLRSGQVVKTYKTFLEIEDEDGVHLYPPMASKQRDDSGKLRMAHSMEVNRWERSVGNPDSKHIISKVNKKGETKWYYRLVKDNGKTIDAAYDPYQHSSDVVLNDQFEEAYLRPNLVTYECVIPKSELTSGYQYREARKDGSVVEAALPVGMHPWKKGIVASHLKSTDRSVYLTRWLMPTRRMENSEVAQMYKDIIDAEKEPVSVPFNVVPPGLLTELEKLGVNIDYEGSPGYRYRQGKKAEKEVQLQTWDDGVVYNHRALVSEETLDKWMSGGWYGSSNPNYAQAYITSMSPRQYLRLTTVYDEDRIRQESKGRPMDWVRTASQDQPIQLMIDHTTGRVEGHEGRHRMAVLEENGVREVPVLLFDSSNKYSKEPMIAFKLKGQEFNGHYNNATATVEDVYPLSQKYRSQIVDKYSAKTAMERMQEKYKGVQTAQFQTWEEDTEENEAMRTAAEELTRGRAIDIMPGEGEEDISSANGLTDEDIADLDSRYDDGGLAALVGDTRAEDKATERAAKEGNAALKEFTESMPEDPMDLYTEQNPVNSSGGDNNGPKPGYEKMNTERAPEKKTLGQRISDAWHRFIRSMVNEADAIHQAGRATGNKALDGMYFYAKAAMQRAQQWVQGQRMNFDLSESGKGLNEIFDPIRAKGEDYYKKFQLYMYHMLNVERMSRSSKAELEAAQQRVDELASMDQSIATMNQDQLKEKARQYREGGGLGYFDMEENGELIAQYWEAVKERDRLLNQQNKPVFGFDTDADQSRQIARDLLADNPEFEKLAQEVYDYVDALLQYRVDAGLITPEDMNRLKETYPHYIPVMYKMQKEDTGRQKKGNIKADDAIMRAKGGSQEMEPLHLALARQTLAVMKNAGYQQLGSEILKEYYDNRAAMSRYVTDVTENEAVWDETAADNDDVNVPYENVVSVIKDGKRYDITLSDDMSYAFKSLQPSKQRLQDWKAMVKANDMFKRLCTAWNPLFMITNPVRDVQDALFYSTDTKRWLKNYPKAISQIAKGGKYWKMYQGMGGVNNSYFDWATGENSGKMGKVEALNMAIEQAPRLAEFMTVLENAERNHGSVTQADLMEAFNAAAEVTTNFGRSGTMGKWINRNLVPFWNPGVQGLSKAVRTVSETKGFKAWANLALKAAALGMLPALLNGLLYKDDDEWDKIDDQMKMEYYLFKTKDGVWIKIPKGRMLAALSMPVVGAQETMRGDDVNWAELGKQAFGSVAPNNPLETNLLSQAIRARLFDKDDPGTTWYGGNIESKRLQSYAPGERYDESTDVISKWLGKKLNLSPKKINYIIDQYSGVIGDLVLPYLTPKAERGISAEIGGKDISLPLSNAFMSRFTLDTVTNNTISGEYYDLLDELGYAAKGGDTTAAIAERFMNRAGGKVSDIYTEIRKIENDPELSDREKTQLTRELRKELNKYQEQVIQDAQAYLDAAKQYMDQHPENDYTDDKAVDAWTEGYNSMQTDEKYFIDADKAASKMKDEVYREVNREHFGAEYALEVYNKDVYAKAQKLNEESGLSYDDYYDFYFDTRYMYADKDEDGKSISGSKKEKIVEYIAGMDITDEQKDALYLASGYGKNTLSSTPWHGGTGSYSSTGRSGGRTGRSSGGSGSSKTSGSGSGSKRQTAKRPSQTSRAGIQTSTISDLVKIIDEIYGGNELAALFDDRRAAKGRTTVDFKL